MRRDVWVMEMGYKGYRMVYREASSIVRPNWGQKGESTKGAQVCRQEGHLVICLECKSNQAGFENTHNPEGYIMAGWCRVVTGLDKEKNVKGLDAMLVDPRRLSKETQGVQGPPEILGVKRG